MRTILYIVVFNFFLVGVVFGQTQKTPSVEKLYISKCKSECEFDSKVTRNEIKDNMYFLDMFFWHNCSSKDTVGFFIDADTLIVDSYSDYSGSKLWHKGYYSIKKNNGPSSFLCECATEFSAQLKNIDSVPKCIKLGGKYWNGRSFSNIELFKRHGWKSFGDNSEKLIFNELKNCLGKDVNDSLVTTILKRLGNDSIIDSSECCFSYEYPSDGIEFVFTKLGKLRGVSLTNLWIKKARVTKFIFEEKEKNDKNLGLSYLKKMHGSYKNKVDGKTVGFTSSEAYYVREKLDISYDSNGKVSQIELIDLIENK